ncbi:MAG: hypothetical protein ACOCRK_02410 [bacterium]
MKKIHLKTKYIDEEAFLQLDKYSNGSTAISFRSSVGEPLSVATVSLGDITPSEGCAFIKNWSENEGVLDCLIDNDMVELTGKEIETGYCKAQEVKLLPKIFEYFLKK